MTDPIVLVALGASKRALGVLPIARRFADLERGEVRVLHVTEETAAEAIVAAAADCGARLIVMGARSADAQPAGAIGDTALAVLGGAACPVVLVDPARTPAGWDLRRMLALHDGSPAVSHALKPATELAREAGAELIVLQVACDERALEAGSIAPPVYVDQVQHSWPGWSKEFLHRLTSICPLTDVGVRVLLGHGEPAAETVRVAGEESADLIALAWSGDDASTLKALLRDAPCPVMVTRVLAS